MTYYGSTAISPQQLARRWAAGGFAPSGWGEGVAAPAGRAHYQMLLDFYNGQQWFGQARGRETRLTFNYVQAFVLKAATYLTARPALVSYAQVSAKQAAWFGRLYQQTADDNDLPALDYATAVDAAVLGDGCYRVLWSAAEGRVQVDACDVMNVEPVWGGNNRRLTALTYRYVSGGVAYEEEWTDARLIIRENGAATSDGPNPYGYIPFIFFANQPIPKSPWGMSDLEPLLGVQDELNRRLSTLSRLLEASGNPAAVVSGATQEATANLSVGPGQLWTLENPAARAYLLDFLGGGSAGAHLRYIEALYRVFHDLAEMPRIAFGEVSGGNRSGIALELELQPLTQKVARKQIGWGSMVRRRAWLILDQWRRFGHRRIADVSEAVLTITWPPLLPQELAQRVAVESQLFDRGIHDAAQVEDAIGETATQGGG